MNLKKNIIIILILIVSIKLSGQDMGGATLLSQKATISQRVGVTDVTITYHSPSVKGRKIFGGIVPYDFKVDGKEYPWRAGSNKNTIIEFSTDVSINGKPLKKGKYGLHIYVEKRQWTFIFSKNADSWGSFQYTPKDDALRTTVSVDKAPFQEWLSYDFTFRKNESAQVELHWENIKASFKVTSDVNNLVIAALESKENKTGADYYDLAEEKMKRKNFSVSEVMGLIDKSITTLEAEDESPRRRGLLFASKIFKADLMIEKGNKQEGLKLRDEMLANAYGFDMYYYGLKPLLLKGDKKRSYQLLTDYVNKEPKNWIAHLSLGEYYLKVNNPKKVVEHFEKAYKYASDNWKNYARYLYLQNKVILKN